MFVVCIVPNNASEAIITIMNQLNCVCPKYCNIGSPISVMSRKILLHVVVTPSTVCVTSTHITLLLYPVIGQSDTRLLLFNVSNVQIAVLF